MEQRIFPPDLKDRPKFNKVTQRIVAGAFVLIVAGVIGIVVLFERS